MILRILSLFLVMVLVSFEAKAAFSPLGIAVLSPVQFPPHDFSVTGVRASVFWGSHRDIYGFDFAGIGNFTRQRFIGTAVSGVFNWTDGNTTVVGAQVAGLANVNKQKTTVTGVQIAAATNYNSAESTVTGVQFSIANLSGHTTIIGFQLGVYNKAKSVYGFQIGLVNEVNNLHGLQIGLLNINHTGFFKYAPILNIGF